MPDVSPAPGTLITLAPAASSLGRLIRSAIDAEQVGARRIHLAADQHQRELAVIALREHTQLIITCDTDTVGTDVITSGYLDASVPESDDLPLLVIAVARLVSAHPEGVGIRGLGSSAVPVLLATLACGGHLLVDDAVEAHPALVTKTSGLARIAGRSPLDQRAARMLLGCG